MLHCDVDADDSEGSDEGDSEGGDEDNTGGHTAGSDDADPGTDSDETDSDAGPDDADPRSEILFWRSSWVSFWGARSPSLSTLLGERWASRNDEQSMTTNLMNVCLTE